MISEKQEVEKLFTELCKQPVHQFPKAREKLEAPLRHGVYIILKDAVVLHVGRTYRRREGLHKRLKDHLYGSSTFTRDYLKGNGAVLRNGCAYQYLVVEDARLRALLEAYTTGILCPKHIGLGE